MLQIKKEVVHSPYDLNRGYYAQANET
jgi:hypothetical protein